MTMDDRWLIEMRKGFLRFIILRIIGESPAHGYEIIKRISTLTRGGWEPSPGSIYPILSLLESRGYITSCVDGKRKVYTLTERGKSLLSRVNAHIQQMHEEMLLLFGDVFSEEATER